MYQESHAKYNLRAPPISPRRENAPSDRAYKDHDEQDRTTSGSTAERLDSDYTPASAKTYWAIREPSKNVTVSAETKARWELLRALAGVKKHDDPQTSRPEASVRDPTQILGPHPHEIVAAQVLQANKSAHTNESSIAPAAGGISHRNASHGRRSQPSGAAIQAPGQGSDGSHRLRPLMLPRMVNRTNSGRRAGSTGNVPIVRPSVTPVPHHQEVPGSRAPSQQEVSEPIRAQDLSKFGIHAPKPLQPVAQMHSGLVVESSTGIPVPGVIPNLHSTVSNTVLSTHYSDQTPEPGRSQIYDKQIPIIYHSLDGSTPASVTINPNIASVTAMNNSRDTGTRVISETAQRSPETAPTAAALYADKSPEELMMLLASGDPGMRTFIYTDEGMEWLLSMFFHGSVLLAKLWVSENLLSSDAKALFR